MTGFITLHRALLDWEWYQDSNAKSLFIHCLLKANWEDKKWRGIDVKRGQFITSVSMLSTELKLTTQQIRSTIKKLTESGEITIQTTNKNTFVTVVKYDVYQNDTFENNKQNNNQITNKKLDSNKQITTTNNYNNIINNNNKFLLEKETKGESLFSDSEIPKEPKRFDFKKNMLVYGFEESLVSEWLLIRKAKKAVNSETAFKTFITEVEKSNRDKNEVLKIIVQKQWKGFDVAWLNNNTFGNEKNKQNTSNFATNR